MNTLRTLRRRYGRTTLITVGIALAIAFSTIMLSISEAIKDSSKDIIEDTGVDLLIEPESDLPPLFLEFTTIFEINEGREIARAMESDNSKIRAAAPWLTKSLYIAKRPDVINYQEPLKFTLSACKGTIPEKNKYFSALDIVDGEWFSIKEDPFYAYGSFDGGTESNNFTHEIVISEPLSHLLEVSVGDIVYLNLIAITDEYTNETIEGWFENATWFKISGIMIESFGSQNALTAHIHLSELQFLTGRDKKDKVNRIYVSLEDKSQREEVKSWLNNEFRYKDEISAHTPEDLLGDISELTKMMEGFSRMVVIITILVATLFISTVLMISTRERSNEIGALRAIGISKATINKMILKESFIICIMALILGLFLGYIVSNFINNYVVDIWPYIPKDFKVTLITPVIIAQVATITLIIAILASLGPCYWAMSLNPVQTLRNE